MLGPVASHQLPMSTSHSTSSSGTVKDAKVEIMPTQHDFQQTSVCNDIPCRASDLLPPCHPTKRHPDDNPLPSSTKSHTPHPLRLSAQHVTDATTRKNIFAISKDTNHKQSFFSGKRSVLITHCETGTFVGTISTGAFRTSSIEITTTDGNNILLSSASATRRKWGFTPRSLARTNSSQDQRWVWQRDKRRKRTVILTDAKRNGQTIARIAGDLLTFEAANLTSGIIDDVFWTALAMAVHVRRQRKHGDVFDVGEAIVGPDYSSTRGGTGVESGGGSSGGDGGGCGGDGGGGCS
jgi:hypothetical protein